jgi:hypothetical protein
MVPVPEGDGGGVTLGSVDDKMGAPHLLQKRVPATMDEPHLLQKAMIAPRASRENQGTREYSADLGRTCFSDGASEATN